MEDNLHDGEEAEDEDEGLLSRPRPSSLNRSNGGVYWAFFILGLCTLFPWNLLISIVEFWHYKFRDTTNPHVESDLQKEFVSRLSIASNVPTALFIVLHAIIGYRFNLHLRVIATTKFIMFLFVILTLLAAMDSDTWQRIYMYLVLAVVVCVNANAAVYQGAIYGVAGKLPPEYMGAVVSGSAMGGIIPAIANIVIISCQVKAMHAGIVCFLFTILVLTMGLSAFLWLEKSPFFCHYNFAQSVEQHKPIYYWRILRRCWVYCFAVFLTFAITLSAFPAVTVLVKSQSPDSIWGQTYFTPVLCILLFNVTDYLGRICASHKYAIPDLLLIVLCALRVFFIPIFIICNISPRYTFFTHDADFAVILALFAFSNGFLGSIAMQFGPKTSITKEDQETTATIMAACLCIGTGTGSFLSFPIVKCL